jgi:hypothetical protein
MPSKGGLASEAGNTRAGEKASMVSREIGVGE